jgi:hypothetical protein
MDDSNDTYDPIFRTVLSFRFMKRSSTKIDLDQLLIQATVHVILLQTECIAQPGGRCCVIPLERMTRLGVLMMIILLADTGI